MQATVNGIAAWVGHNGYISYLVPPLVTAGYVFTGLMRRRVGWLCTAGGNLVTGVIGVLSPNHGLAIGLPFVFICVWSFLRWGKEPAYVRELRSQLASANARIADLEQRVAA